MVFKDAWGMEWERLLDAVGRGGEQRERVGEPAASGGTPV